MSAVEFPEPFSLPEVPAAELGSRALFPDLTWKAYLAHAAISPASVAVTRSVSEAVRIVAQLGTGSFPILSAQRERLRRKIASLLGVETESIALTPGCTRAITDVALGLPYRPGDTLLTYRGEFPANVTPWQMGARSRGARVELIDLPSATDPECASKIVSDLERIFAEQRAAGRAVRWVAVSAVQFQTGLRMPLAEMAAICHENGAKILVDGIQGCGSVPLNCARLGIDAFFSGAHKWLLGLEGVGFSYLSEELLHELSPVTAGWLSHVDGDLFLFRGAGHLDYERPLLDSPRVFEGSTMNAVGFVALEAGVDTVASLDPAEIFLHVQSYHEMVAPLFAERGFRSLRAVDPGLRSCLLSFEPPEGIDVPPFALALRQHGIMVSIPDGLVRIAPHFANSRDELDVLREAVDQALAVARR